MSSIELLAPAGTIETFYAAMDGGADAVYVGAPGFNARNLAKDLRLEEIGAMVDYCRRFGKKIYIAANSLVLERELESVIDNLALLNVLQPDGLIIQDLGVMELAKTHFPHLELHGSTLMTVHNSDGVRFLSEQGFERVVLARELTLREIEAIRARAGEVELEVFIHGAMCFSYSGLCLFSSYLGGKSGLRGRCVQPCRRAYSSGTEGGRAGSGRGRKEGRHQKSGGRSRYLFSMNDLTGLDAVHHLREIGVTSLKIEGRLRSPHYVESIVSAYRLVLDADEATREKALGQAQQLAENAMSRKTTSGYFFSPQPVDAITPFHSGNMGFHLGKFSTVKKVGSALTCKFVIKNALEVGARLRLHAEPSGERTAFRVKSLFVEGKQEIEAAAGSKVSLELPPSFVLESGSAVEVYKVDGAPKSVVREDALDISRVAKELRQVKKELQQQANAIKAHWGQSDRGAASLWEQSGKATTPRPGRGGRQRTTKVKLPLEWWLKVDSVKVLLGKLPFFPDRYLISFEKQMLSQVGTIKSGLGGRSRNVIWALPPVISENDLLRVKKQVTVLLRSGFRSFQIGHPSQVRLFGSEKVHLYGDYTLNVMNSGAVSRLDELGIVGSQVAIELDKKGLRELLEATAGQGKGGQNQMRLGLYVYGAPPLYTARLASKHLPIDQKIESLRNEPYVIRKKEGYTQTFPEKPFSLLPYLEEIKEAGIQYVVVDSCGHSSKKNMEELKERLMVTGRYKKLPTFNYFGNLE